MGKLKALRGTWLLALSAACGLATSAHADVFVFDSDPFAGSTALVTPGRQIVGGEPFIVFDPGADTIVVDPVVFDIDPVIFAFNGLMSDLPDMAFNFVGVQTLDADGNPNNGVLMNAGLAANLIADRLTTDGAGFFVYFNSGLDLVRLVYSTNLADPTADLKILARFTNLSGQTGRDALSAFGPQIVTEAPVPEPSTWALMILGFAAAGAGLRYARATAIV